jgi:hypothetical protein
MRSLMSFVHYIRCYKYYQFKVDDIRKRVAHVGTMGIASHILLAEPEGK